MSRLRKRFVFGFCFALVAFAVAACGAPESEAPPATPAEPPAAPASTMPDPAAASGVYEVHGVTVQASDGELREIGGVLRLHVQGETFSATYELETTLQGPDEEVSATVAGWGQGMVVGDTMAGTISSSMVPAGVDVAAAGEGMLPEQEFLVMSSSVARFTPAGTLQVELQNHPGIGQQYSPSVTVLEGRRVRPLRVGAASGEGP